jgi:hypothetical protein
MKGVRGCQGRTQISRPIFEELRSGVHYRYWSCPLALIPDSVSSFLRLYKYQKTFPSAPMPKATEVSSRFAMAYLWYEAKLNEHTKEAMKEFRRG